MGTLLEDRVFDVERDVEAALSGFNELRRDVNKLSENFGALAVLVNNIRQCVDTQLDIFNNSNR